LQSTVEGLSVAAITYYIVGLVSFLAKGAGGDRGQRPFRWSRWQSGLRCGGCMRA